MLDPALANRFIDLAIAIAIVSTLILFSSLAWPAARQLTHHLTGRRQNLRMRRRIRRELQAARDRSTVDAIARDTPATIEILSRPVHADLNQKAA